MSNSKKMVTLASGKEVSWDEFSSWSAKKQVINLSPPNKGKRFSLESCLKVVASGREYFKNGDRRPRRTGYANKSSREITTPKGKFPSIKSACEAYMVTKDGLMKMMRQYPNLFYFTDPVYHHKGRTKPKSIKTPAGIFPSLKLAAEHYGVTDQTINNWAAGAGRYAGQFFYVDAEVESIPLINNKPVMTPKGRFNSLKEAAKAFNVHYSVISKKAKFGKDGYYFLTP